MVQDKNAIVNIVSISINIKFSFTFHHFTFIQSIFSLYELTIKMVKIFHRMNQFHQLKMLFL